MKISCNRLKSYIKNSEDIDWLNIWNIFTIRTAEVEDVKVVGNTFTNVVVAEIKECVKHPDSDHMSVLQVDCGEKDLIQVVCGANNVRVGLKTAYVKVGGTIDDFTISARPLRGILSNGMCCSGRELGISDDHDGIIELPDSYEVGKDIKDYLPIDDIIVEIDNKSLTNRPDLWGHFGIAREIAAITNHELMDLELEDVPNNLEDLDIVVNNPDLCYRYTGIKIDNIKNNKTPLDMQIFLYYVGMRSISLIVDLTNYIMLELGQPMHAFDAKKVKNIEVSVAKNNEVFKTLDGEERKLTDQMLMIKNKDENVAIAGVMGGENSEILDDTKCIVLESACFNAASIRKTATSLGLRTESSARFEKSLDPNMCDIAIKRFIYLLKKENESLKIVSNLTDKYPKVLEEATIELKKELLNTYMGFELDDKTVKNILESLDFKVKVKDQSYEVVVPTFRHSKDINIAQDLIEEIARIYGLENIESKQLELTLESRELDTVFNQEYEVKRLLATKYDMHEVHSYIWYDTELLNLLGIKKDGVKLLGKKENNILRDDLGLSLLNIVKENVKHSNTFNIFEIGTIIDNNQNKRVLSIILLVDDKQIDNSYNYAKNIIKYIFKSLKNMNVELINNVSEKSYYDDNLGKVIKYNDLVLGQLNVLKSVYTNKIVKKKAIIVIDIDFDKYVELNRVDLKAQELSKYPTVDLDYTIILSKEQKYDDLKSVLSTYKSKLINDYKLISVYESKYTIRYNLGSDFKTLEQKDLQTFKKRFIEHIRENGFEIME